MTELGRQECGGEEVQVSLCVVSLQIIMTKVQVWRWRTTGRAVSRSDHWTETTHCMCERTCDCSAPPIIIMIIIICNFL